MELQVSYSVCPQISTESILRRAQKGSAGNIKEVVGVEKRGDHRTRSMSGSYTYSCVAATQNERFGIYGVSERKECNNHISEMGKYEICIPKSRILVQRILCGYGGEKHKSDTRICRKSAEKR